MNHRTRTERGLAGLAILALIFGVGLAAMPADAAEQKMTDQAVADAIENEFLFDRAVPTNNIDVSVAAGVATLKGKVDNVLAKDRATRIAETVRGVKAVVNRIDVEPRWGRMDWQIEQDAETALLRNAATESWEIDADVANNVATLDGSVSSWHEKQLAAKVVKGVRGVREVDNQLDVDYADERLDGEIKSEVKQLLRWDVRVDDGLIDVDVDDGKVKLTGTVGSAAEKRQARYNAWVVGVTDVDAKNLDVARWARDEDLRKDKYVDKPDKKIEDGIELAMLYDPRVLSTNVQTDVSAGMATLRGEVRSVQAKRAAAQDARNTVGVIRVSNRLKVRPNTPTDETIEQRIENALLADPYVERYEIIVTVVDGTAYLSGEVDSYFDKMQADDLAASTYGVEEVQNTLDVDYDEPLAYDPYVYDYDIYDYDWYDYEPGVTFKTDGEIKEDIVSEMWWSPFVDSDEVTVDVEDGTATLTGTVDSWSEYSSATENAYEGGAVWVDNDVIVE